MTLPSGETAEIEVTLPDRLVESIDATVEQSGAYADRDALVRAAIATETAGFDGAVADDDADAGASVQCVLCDETSATVEAHEQHMDDIHADGERHRWTPSIGPQGTFPWRCSRCDVVCETPAELADARHHDWPGGRR